MDKDNDETFSIFLTHNSLTEEDNGMAYSFCLCYSIYGYDLVVAATTL